MEMSLRWWLTGLTGRGLVDVRTSGRQKYYDG